MSRAWLLISLVGCAPADVDALNTDGDCMDDEEEAALGTDPSDADPDGDGLDDCEELDHGTDPNAEDGDGDGLSDVEELDCASDPNDADEVCHSCGWPHDDPGDLVSTGAEEGDVIENIELVDQCGETLPLWDLAGEYHILFMTAVW